MNKLYMLYVVVLFSIASITAQEINKVKLDKYFNLVEEYDKGMGSISIYSNGKEMYRNTIGFSDVPNKTKANALTKYRIGSITKTYTATVIMQLVEERKLNLEALLSEYFPKIPNSRKITIENLLRHKSGLFNITEEENFIAWISKPRTREEMLARMIKNGTIFEANEKTQYSNTNFILLSYIAEDIENKSFSDILNSRIIKPLSLQRTQYGEKINLKKNEALPYYIGETGWNAIEVHTDLSGPMGAGAIVSTASELAIFYDALFLGKLVSETSLTQMTDVSGGMGMGLGGGDIDGRKGFGHQGGIDGFQSMAIHLQKESISVAYVSNGVNISIIEIIKNALGIYFNPDYELPSFKAFKMNLDDLKKYVGEYISDTAPFTLIIYEKEGKLFGGPAGNNDSVLTPTKPDQFKLESEGVTLDFKPNENSVKLSQGGHVFLFSKEKK